MDSIVIALPKIEDAKKLRAVLERQALFLIYRSLEMVC